MAKNEKHEELYESDETLDAATIAAIKDVIEQLLEAAPSAADAIEEARRDREEASEWYR